MVRYLKYIVLVFGSIGLLVGSFFFYQNRVDIQTALEYEDRFELEYLSKNCPKDQLDYLYPCLKQNFKDYLDQVSLTGTNIGLKMAFSGMDEIKQDQKKFTDKKQAEIEFALAYIEINNMALDNAYRRYFGFDNLYGGFVSSLGKYYPKAYEFSENMILGLKSGQGIDALSSEQLKSQYQSRLGELEKDYYRIKDEVEAFIEKEVKQLGKE